jgi:hypothetical protein
MADQEPMTDQDPTQDRPDPDLASTAPETGTRPAPSGGPYFPDGKESDVNAEDAPTHPLEPVSPEVAASLSDALRAMYDTVVDEPLPDAFAQLLSRLDDSDG